jgi:hypothetical protein
MHLKKKHTKEVGRWEGGSSCLSEAVFICLKEVAASMRLAVPGAWRGRRWLLLRVYVRWGPNLKSRCGLLETTKGTLLCTRTSLHV